MINNKPTVTKLMEEVRREDKIREQTKDSIPNECVLNKKSMKCEEHDCA